MRVLRWSTRLGVFALSLALGAGSANALPSLDLVYLGGATGGQPSPSMVLAEVGDTIQFAVSVDVDTDGVGGFAFVLRWDADGEDELDLVGHRERYGGGNGQLTFRSPNPTPPPDYIEANYNLINDSETQESDDVQGGYVYSYGATPASLTGPFAFSLSFRMGVVSFRVKNNLNNGGADIELGFFRNTDISFFDDFGNANFYSVTPNFGSIAVDTDDPDPPDPETVVTFDGTAPIGALTGIFDGIDWGATGWYTFDQHWGACGGPLAIPLYFVSRFSFIESSVLTALDVSLNGSVQPQVFIIVSRDVQGRLLEFKVAQATSVACQTVDTGFTQPAHDIVLLDLSGRLLNVAIDNVTYLTMP